MKLLERPLLGKCLKRIRKDKGWSMIKMGDIIGIAQSTLSKVENGQLSLSYDKLITISQRLDLDIEELFTDKVKHISTSSARIIVDRHGDMSLRKTQKMNYRSLAIELKKRLMVIYYVEKGYAKDAKLLPDGGFNAERFIYVLKGQMVFYSEHYEKIILNVGDSIYYDVGMKYGITALKGQTVKALAITTSTDENYMEIERGVATAGFAYADEWERAQYSEK